MSTRASAAQSLPTTAAALPSRRAAKRRAARVPGGILWRAL